MKKVLGLIILSIALVLSAIGLSACGEDPEPPHTHSYVDTVVAPTCVDKGYTLHKCECGEEYTDTQVNALGHDYVDKVCSNCLKKQPSEGLKIVEYKKYCVVEGVGTCVDSDIVIPSIYNGKPITEIGSYAFYNCDYLEAIEIPASVTSIGENAFYGCNDLTTVTFGENSQLQSIGKEAFDNCNDLTTVTFGENSQLQSIGDYAFYSCDSLETIEIPARVTSIGERAFSRSESLTNIIVDESNLYYKSIDGNLYSKGGKTLLRYVLGKTATTFAIPEGVTSIGDDAFSDCNSLEAIEIPASVTSICEDAFFECNNLIAVTFGENSQLQSIGYGAFYSCESLEAIEIPASVTSIGERAFWGCESLEAIEIPASVTIIGENAFYGCDDLTTVTFGENSVLESIGEWVFHWCDSLEAIEIPASVTSIGDYAFSSCSDLTTVYYGGTASDWANISIESSNYNLKIATIYYYVENESDLPADNGNYWHYVDGVPTVWGNN